jgi:hypothetical protein
VGFVSVLLEELLLELLVVGVVCVVVVVLVTTVLLVVGGAVLLLLLLLLLEADEVWELWQSLAASRLTVAAPWPRFCTRVVLTDGGSAAT